MSIETPRATAVREFYEETGCRLDSKSLLLLFSWRGSTHYYFKTGINKEIKMWNIELPCATENHEVYIAGRGYVKVKDLKDNDVIINEVNGRVERVKIRRVVKVVKE